MRSFRGQYKTSDDDTAFMSAFKNWCDVRITLPHLIQLLDIPNLYMRLGSCEVEVDHRYEVCEEEQSHSTPSHSS